MTVWCRTLRSGISASARYTGRNCTRSSACGAAAEVVTAIRSRAIRQRWHEMSPRVWCRASGRGRCMASRWLPTASMIRQPRSCEAASMGRWIWISDRRGGSGNGCTDGRLHVLRRGCRQCRSACGGMRRRTRIIGSMRTEMDHTTVSWPPRCSPRSGRNWAHELRAAAWPASFGYEGGACRLSDAQQCKPAAWIAETLPRTTREVGAWIEEECGIEYQGRSGLIALLHRLGMEHRKAENGAAHARSGEAGRFHPRL